MPWRPAPDAVERAVHLTDAAYRNAPNQTHRIVAVLVGFLGALNPRHRVTAEDVADAWDDLATIGRVVRDDYLLEPDGDPDALAAGRRWWVESLVGIAGDTLGL